jgi:hypothetical protein
MRSAALAMCSQSAPRAALTVAILSFLCALDLLAWCCRKLLALREAIGAAEATKADVEVLCALPITLPRSCGMLDATVSTATRRGDDSRSHRLLQLSMGWLGSGVTAQCRTARCREDCTRSCERCTSETND